jgi:hypothetical protein
MKLTPSVFKRISAQVNYDVLEIAKIFGLSIDQVYDYGSKHKVAQYG